jgi:hypothetical protein
MAFVRWRGNSAQLLTTVYENGRSRQLLLANLHGAYYATQSVQEGVAARFPSIRVDWRMVNRALAAGPPESPPPGEEEWDWAAAEDALRRWAVKASPAEPREADCLRKAAEILTHWRARADQERRGPNPAKGG